MTRLPSIRPSLLPTPTSSPNDSVGVLFDALAPDYQRVRAEVGWDPWPHVEAALGGGPLTGWRILDIGCGDGEVASTLTSRQALVTGVDASPIMCEQARTFVDQNATFFVYRLGDETQSLSQITGVNFDAAIALGCLEYVADQYDALSQLLSTVKPGGIVLLTVELRGPDLPGGNAPAVPLFDGWVRYRLSRYEIKAWADKHLECAEVEEVPGYHLGERSERLVYARVIGFKRSKA
jgi:SAM-dependent methyltransferase